MSAIVIAKSYPVAVARPRAFARLGVVGRGKRLQGCDVKDEQ
jgi:hypothetical protein